MTPTENKNPDRNYATDVTSKAATERATAMAIEADKVEFTDCAFLGSQDTLYTGNSATNMYFKNCHIEGNTDYIFGDGNAVFDGCELRFAGTVLALQVVILQHISQPLLQQLRLAMYLETVQ